MRISDWSSDVCSSDLIEKRRTAAGDDAFFDRGAGRVESVVDAILALLHLDLRSAADLDDRNAAGELCQAFLQLFLVVIRRRGFDLRSEEHTSELQSLMRISYAVFCLKKKNKKTSYV